MQLDHIINDYYAIRMKANISMFVAVNGTSNGTASGTLPTSPGNVYIDTYDVWRSQEWAFELISHPTAATPTGWLEAVTSTEISGWAWRSDSPNLAVDVCVVLTNTSTNEQIPLIGTANLHRNDLQNSGYGNGNHGFIISIEWNLLPGGTYSISAYGVGATGTLHLLSGSPKTYTVSNAVEDEFKGSMALNSNYTSYLYPGQTHIYSFIPPQDDYYRVFTTGSTDVYGELWYNENSILDEDDDDGEGANFKIEYEMDANHTYYIYVRGLSQTTSGNYTIKIESMFLDKLQELHELAKDYTSDNLPRSVELTMQYIRRGKYFGAYKAFNQWGLAAGDIDNEFETFVEDNNFNLVQYFTFDKEDNFYYYSPNGEKIDIIHLAATYNVYLYDTFTELGDDTELEEWVDNLGGWAGDLRSIIPFVMRDTNYSTDYNTIYAEAASQIGANNDSSNLGKSDLLADTDAYNLYNLPVTDSLKSKFISYYSTGILTRYTDFSNGMTRDEIFDLAKDMMTNSVVNLEIVWPLKKVDENDNETSEALELTDTQLNAICYAYADYIWGKAELE